MADERPAYVFVGGVSHTPEFFDAIVKELDDRGYAASAVAYPTCAKDNKNAKMSDEVMAIQAAVAKHVDEQNKDVVLVCHSYGGWPGSRALVGYDKATRQKHGKTTGIVEAVFLCAFLLPEDASMAKFSYLPDWITVEDGQRVPNEAAGPLLFSDLEPEARKHWLSKLAWQRNDFTGETVPGAPWHLDVPKTYIITTDDKTMTPQMQMGMLTPVINSTWSIKSLKTGHSPFINRPAELAKVLLQPTY